MSVREWLKALKNPVVLFICSLVVMFAGALIGALGLVAGTWHLNETVVYMLLHAYLAFLYVGFFGCCAAILIAILN